MKLKHFLFLLGFLFITACGTSTSNEYKDPEAIEMSDNDRSVQYYLPMNVNAWAQGRRQTIDDLRPSGRLLLTPGGNVKAAEYSNGYQKVYRFRCVPIEGGWYEVTCWLKDPFDGSEYTLVCYTRDKI